MKWGDRGATSLAGFSFPETRLPPSEILRALHFTVLVRNYVPMRNNILISFRVGIKGGVGFVFFYCPEGLFHRAKSENDVSFFPFHMPTLKSSKRPSNNVPSVYFWCCLLASKISETKITPPNSGK